jgi:hypothetical protein
LPFVELELFFHKFENHQKLIFEVSKTTVTRNNKKFSSCSCFGPLNSAVLADIAAEVSALSSHLALPGKGHLVGAFHVFACLEKRHNARMVFVMPQVKQRSLS